MIQSDKSEFYNMNIKNYIDKTVNFSIRRLAELSGLLLIIISILLFFSLISYSPEDPNFLFSDNTTINNLSTKSIC